MTMKVRLKMKNRSHGCDINRHRAKHGHTKYKICLIAIMVKGIKHYLSNILSSIHSKV